METLNIVCFLDFDLIWRRSVSSKWAGASDARKDGMAVGY